MLAPQKRPSTLGLAELSKSSMWPGETRRNTVKLQYPIPSATSLMPLAPLPKQFGISGQLFPIMSMSPEAKNGRTAGGWMERPFTRLEAHRIQNGSMDLDVLVLDEDGQLVMLTYHTALIVPL